MLLLFSPLIMSAQTLSCITSLCRTIDGFTTCCLRSKYYSIMLVKMRSCPYAAIFMDKSVWKKNFIFASSRFCCGLVLIAYQYSTASRTVKRWGSFRFRAQRLTSINQTLEDRRGKTRTIYSYQTTINRSI